MSHFKLQSYSITSIAFSPLFSLFISNLPQIGNEGRGVSPVVERHSDVAITIPPASNCIEDTHSLNVSVATSVILHFLSRQ
ncbi:hypothetical protein Anas_11424 [Armadillidium nasatum]|uniref:tRNA/rRNA methyltransferase SpoU type domain-containing protein n=1 Tax=Armadillidium nasatum TaxID=96803 RepID=A0A5N5TFW4_9CRUS|nr:hypothetical protein Anas_11424 [Armadillidium nasatum]